MAPSWSELSPYDGLVRTELIEPRDYQINIAKSIYSGSNTLVVLPTGLGKTLIAIFVIAKALHEGKKAILLAPTKPLSEQHHKSLETLLNIEKSQILLLTGELTGRKRKALENGARVIAATPQTVANDLKAGRLDFDDIGVVIFDECHKTVGRYAYTYIADHCKENSVQAVGLTASPGSNREKIMKIVDVLGVQNIEIRISTDPDVEPYVMGKTIRTHYVEKSPELNAILAELKPVIDQHLHRLYTRGLTYTDDITKLPKGRLLEIGDNIKKIQADNYRFMAMYSYVHVLDLEHAYNLAASEGLYPFVSYFDSLQSRENKSRTVSSILKNENVAGAIRRAKEALAEGREHPKMFELIKLIKADYPHSALIIFAQYRSTIKKITELLNAAGITARAFVGKGDGITQENQKQVIQDFRDGAFKVLVATSIGEEGLDIPSVDAVVFYEPVPSEIRNIQRKGRAGRLAYGEVVILVTKGTKDETYLMISRNRERRMREIVLAIKDVVERRGAGQRRGVQKSLLHHQDRQ
jgi:Fanconi anemia group M protein